MSLTIYHNPRCSKSRAALELLRSAGIEPRVVLYLDDPPPADRILALSAMLGRPVRDLLRAAEPEAREAADLPDLEDDAALAAWLALHPRALQRPVVVDDRSGRARIGRPPDNIKDLLP